MKSFVDTLSSAEQKLVNQLRKAIKSSDKTISEKPGKIMSASDALCYMQEDVMKYGLARTKSGYTFHSMVMYANNDVFELTKKELTGVKFQKGCVNIPSLNDLNMDAFKRVLAFSAKKDFQSVIDHYKTKVRKRTP